MIIPKPEDALHQSWLVRLLVELADDAVLNQILIFKGGTCAAMLDRLDRFSVDLDFDLEDSKKKAVVKTQLLKCIHQLGLQVKTQSQRGIQILAKYPVGKPRQRNTIKVEVQFPSPRANQYVATYISCIDRSLLCHTPETMLANKLVAITDRFKKHQSLAGRDVYDIHHFLNQGLRYDTAVIEERTGLKPLAYLKTLKAFIAKHVTHTTLSEDLNMLLAPEQFQRIRKTLKTETLLLIDTEIKRYH